MPNACFVDTNILLYARDRAALDKQRRAAEWLDALTARELVVVNPQVLNEFAHNVLRKLKHIRPDQLRALIEAMRPWCTAPIDEDTALHGLAIHLRYRFSFFDCTLLASAIAHGCDVFLSEDLGHEQFVADLRIVDPFRTDLESFLERN
jgi:predicted nucleic acid-binding protein